MGEHWNKERWAPRCPREDETRNKMLVTLLLLHTWHSVSQRVKEASLHFKYTVIAGDFFAISYDLIPGSMYRDFIFYRG